jgi:hypothetical protein
MVDEGIVERIVEVFSRRVKSPEVFEKIKNAGKLVKDREDLFHYVMGLAWNYRIPLTPRDVGDIMRILGLL